ISMPSGVPFYVIIHLFITKIDHINPYVAGVAGVTLFLGILIKKFYPTIPYMIPTMLLGSLLGYYLNDHYTFAVTGIKTIGALPAALPPMSLPDFSLATIRKLASPALAISFLALTEAVAIAKAIALRSGQNIDGNQEFVGQGLSNVIGSLFSAYPSSGSFNRSGLNYESGAQTPLASIFAAVFLGTIILFASGLVAYFPLAVMAAILFLVAWGLIDFHHIKEIIKTSRSETALLAITFLATLFLELEFAVLLGVFISIALYLRRTSKPVIEYCVPDSSNLRHRFVKAEKFPSCPQLAVVRLTGSLFFGAMSCFDASFKEIKEKHPTQKYLLIIGRGINFLDLSGANLLIQYIRSYREEGGDLFVCNLNEEITARFKKLGVTEFLGEDHLYCSKAEAVASIYLQLDPKVCAACATHVFYECQKQ
ncbi:MAG: SulP family inorganic anion transporter, partial [Candidatus Falkowbacteria bacterium]|nr:SulP family inorganic anion transporter [Candidatus Falkowbacteria bacterium]